MSAQAHYFKIGIFVIVASVLLIAGVIILGADKLFQPRLYLETYIDESVQGLDVGTPIKFRGVEIGSVKDIDFVFNIYSQSTTSMSEHRSVYVLMQVKPSALGNSRGESVPVFLEHEVDKGLRVKLAPQGLTGQYYLELDYMNPRQYPVQPVDWNPRYHYIPSVKSTIGVFTDSISEVFGRLQRFNFESLLTETTSTLRAVRGAVDAAAIHEVSDELQLTMASIRRATDNVNQLFEQANVAGLTSDTQAFLQAATRVMDQNRPQLQQALQELNATLASARRIGERLEGYLGSEQGRGDLDRLRASIGSLSQAATALASSVDRTLGKADRLMASQQHDLEVILENLRQITENLSALTEQARSHPSGLFFSEPPPRVKLEAK